MPFPPDHGMDHAPRRAVLRAAAWSVPVVAATAATPLAAASCGEAGTAAFATASYTRASRTSGSGVIRFPSGATLSYELSAAPGTNTAFGTDNLTVADGAILLGDYSRVAAPSVGYNSNYTSTFRMSFAAPVTDVSFDIFDIDAIPGSFREHIRVVGAIATRVGSRVSLSEGQYRPTADTNIAVTDLAGSVSFRFPTPITSFTIEVNAASTRASASTSTNGHDVFLRNMRVTLSC